MAKRRTFKEIQDEASRQTKSATIAECLRTLRRLDYPEAANALARMAAKDFKNMDVNDYFGVSP